MVFLGLKFWPKVIFWVYETCREFFGSQKENRGTFLGCKTSTKGFFWVDAKKSSDFLGRQILKL